eukprot:CAMPEP_0181356708 /NCGR_PEP_ID=MMETSP1106-20121128/4565_1 /TAXON_ID=81844 /ORGANISM="Mantoniella antarctica, Strain SL-175" /LENGTH=54 /DNA_ID=CAMNT_0023469509 /DNA_START=58 /DNA_END=219 /DNA_ORIENTATION=+
MECLLSLASLASFASSSLETSNTVFILMNRGSSPRNRRALSHSFPVPGKDMRGP